MLETIKGMYENGVVRPLEKVCAKGRRRVLITFMDFVSDIHKKDLFLEASGSWDDIDTDKLKKHIYADRKVLNRRVRKL